MSKPQKPKPDWRFQMSRSFWLSPELSLDQKGVVAVLAAHADVSLECWPTKKAISEACGISERTLWQILQDLRSKGFISWTEFRDEQGRARNRYKLEPPCKICVMGKAKPTMKNLQGGHREEFSR